MIYNWHLLGEQLRRLLKSWKTLKMFTMWTPLPTVIGHRQAAARPAKRRHKSVRSGHRAKWCRTFSPTFPWTVRVNYENDFWWCLTTTIEVTSWKRSKIWTIISVLAFDQPDLCGDGLCGSDDDGNWKTFKQSVCGKLPKNLWRNRAIEKPFK